MELYEWWGSAPTALIFMKKVTPALVYQQIMSPFPCKKDLWFIYGLETYFCGAGVKQNICINYNNYNDQGKE